MSFDLNRRKDGCRLLKPWQLRQRNNTRCLHTHTPMYKNRNRQTERRERTSGVEEQHPIQRQTKATDEWWNAVTKMKRKKGTKHSISPTGYIKRIRRRIHVLTLQLARWRDRKCENAAAWDRNWLWRGGGNHYVESFTAEKTILVQTWYEEIGVNSAISLI